ncbi:MAG: nucleotide-binding protein [Planctomycetes bacterium]|nr:nucleotide-binding protein [Planctomycetota bacterium]
MRLGVFLDVDGVLTEEAVNMQIAKHLGVADELQVLEEQFGSGAITNNEFNREFIPLFRRAGFKEEFCRENFDKIRTRMRFQELLLAGDDIALVSSGPSYYLDVLGEKFGIKPENILCSRYSFDGDGLLTRCDSAVSGVHKGHWVQQRVKHYDLTLGVGDNVEHDVPFLAHCSIKIFMGSRGLLDYLNAREIQPILDVVRAVRSGLDWQDRLDGDLSADVAKLRDLVKGEKSVFIMTPYREENAEYRELLRTIQHELAVHGFKGHLAKDFTIHPELWRNVRAFMGACSYGIAIFTPDDRVTGHENDVHNPNVAAELGYMLSRSKPVLLLKEKRIKKLFTDFGGFVTNEFDLKNAEATVRPLIREWSRSLT